MRFNIAPAIGPNGEAANKMSIESGGYKKLDLPEEYLKGDCFWIKKGKNAAIVIRSRVNPLTQEKTEIRKTIKIPLDRTFSNAQIDRLIGFMRESGERLVNIKDIYDSGYLQLPVNTVDI